MVRWNLRAAARLADAAPAERRRWTDLADALVDGYDPTTRLYEQFRGYLDLEPLLIADVVTPPVAADVLLGRDRIARSQVIKQPDVLMLHVLVPETTGAGSLGPNLDLYAPRTAHGSSLSPASMALLLARAGRGDAGLDLLRRSLRIDLDDVGGTTSAGVHVGACGGAWQALVHGFLGARVADGTLVLEPVLPTAWPRLEVRFRCLGHDLVVGLDADRLTVEASGPIRVLVPPTVDREVRVGETIRLDRGGRHE
jgi:trehalose/maltose hydrolase-like predicted phosphorylase